MTTPGAPPVKLAALWKRKSKAGKDYLGGRLNSSCNLFVYPNLRKKSPNDPDAFLYLAPEPKATQKPGTENLPPVVM